MMFYRSIVVAGALFLGACSKSDPGLSTTTSALASASPTGTGAATTSAPNQAPAAATPTDDYRAEHMMPGMPSGMPMHGHSHDGGMGHPMPGQE